MTHTSLQTSRLIVGVILIITAVVLLTFAVGNFSVAGYIALGVLGLISIAIARRD